MSDPNSLAATRSRRANAGSRLKQLIEKEEQASGVSNIIYSEEDENVQLLFQEDDNDAEFRESDQDTSGIEKEEDSEVEDMGEDQDIALPKNAVSNGQNEITDTEPAVNSDDVLSDSDLSATEDDDSEGERDLQNSEKEKKRKKKSTPIIPAIKKPKVGTQKVKSRIPPKHSELLLDIDRRASSRKSAMRNKEILVQKLKEDETRRAALTPVVRVDEIPLTQEDRLAQAVETERENVSSLHSFLEQEIVKKEHQKLLFQQRRLKLRNVIRVSSKETFVGPLDELEDAWHVQDLFDKKRKVRRRKASADAPEEPRLGDVDTALPYYQEMLREKREREENLERENKKDLKEGESREKQIGDKEDENSTKVEGDEGIEGGDMEIDHERNFLLDGISRASQVGVLESDVDIPIDPSSNSEKDFSPQVSQASAAEDSTRHNEVVAKDSFSEEGVLIESSKISDQNMAIDEKVERGPEKDSEIVSERAVFDRQSSEGDQKPTSITGADGALANSRRVEPADHTKLIPIDEGIDSLCTGDIHERSGTSAHGKEFSEMKNNFSTDEKRVTFAIPEHASTEASEGGPEEPMERIEEGSQTDISYRRSKGGFVYEGPVQQVGRNLICLVNFDEDQYPILAEPTMKSILFGKDANLGSSRKFKDVKTVFKSSIRQENPYATSRDEENEILRSVTDINSDDTLFEALKRLPRLGMKESLEVEEEDVKKEETSEIQIRTEAPSGLSLPNGNKKLCLISGKEARYFDPSTGLPYENKDVYKVIKTIEQGLIPWYCVTRDQNAYGDVQIYLNHRNGTRHAKGVPEGFDGC